MSTPAPAASDGRSPFYRLLVDNVKKGKCILFLGAGVHFPPPAGSRFSYPVADRLPLGAELARTLAEECEFNKECPNEEPTDLKRVSLCYETKLGRNNLAARIQAAVGDKGRPSPAVCGLAELPFPLVMTTNYDKLFEKALGGVGKDPFVSGFDPSEAPAREYPVTKGDPSSEKPFVFKMHGDVDVPQAIVITDEDYIGLALRMGTASNHPVPQSIRYAVTRQPLLFVGYSLLDYDLRLLMRALRGPLDPTYRPDTYSVNPEPDPLIKSFYTPQGFRFIAEDVWQFVPQLYADVLEREMPL